MFLRCKKRYKDGKEHLYWSIVENRRVSGGRVLQRHVLYLGELNGRQEASWQKTIDLFAGEGAAAPQQVSLFPQEHMPLDAGLREIPAVGIRLSSMRLLKPRQWGACWLGCQLWEQLGLDDFWAERLPVGRQDARWADILKALADLNARKTPLGRDAFHQALGAAKKEAGRDVRHVKVEDPEIGAAQVAVRFGHPFRLPSASGVSGGYLIMEEHGKTTGAGARAGEIPTCRDPQGETLGRARVKLPWLQFATFEDAPFGRLICMGNLMQTGDRDGGCHRTSGQLRSASMKDLQLLRSLSKLTEARGDKEALVAAMEVFRQTLDGHYYSALYGRVGCASVDIYHPGEGWLGIDSQIARAIARHHSSHPFSTDFFANARPAVYLRSNMVGEREWRRTSIYQCLDSRLGIEDMIGLYFPVPSGQFGALFCGSRSVFRQSAFEDARLLHMVLMPLLDNVPEVSLESAAAPDELSPREHDVMNWLAQGKSNSDIGVMLGISQHTVRKHLEHIFRKLGVENRTAAAKEFRERVHWR